MGNLLARLCAQSAPGRPSDPSTRPARGSALGSVDDELAFERDVSRDRLPTLIEPRSPRDVAQAGFAGLGEARVGLADGGQRLQLATGQDANLDASDALDALLLGALRVV